MNNTSTIADPGLLNELLALLQCAVQGHDNESQKKVYGNLSSIEEDPRIYVGLAQIARTESIDINIRQMALITLKSVLKRNEGLIEINPEQLGNLKAQVLEVPMGDSEKLMSAQRSLISQLCRWNRSLDIRLMMSLVEGLSSDYFYWAVDALFTILEDIRFETENISCYQSPEFLDFLRNYTRVFGLKIHQADERFATRLLGCMNLVVKYFQADSDTCSEYLHFYLIPILQLPTVAQPLLIQTFDGLMELVENGSTHILKHTASLETVILLQPTHPETMKRWVNLFLDLIEVDNAGEEVLRKYLPQLVPKLIRYLEFRSEDELNIKMEMEEEANPYEYEEDEDDYSGVEQRGFEGGCTLRRLAVMAINRILDSYTDDLWAICEPQLKSSISEEISVLLTGIIFSKLEEHLDFLQEALPSIISLVRSPASPRVLKCTCLWTIQNVVHLVVREPVVQYEVQTAILESIEQEHQLEAKEGTFSEIQHTAYSALDELVRVSEAVPSRVKEIVGCIEHGIKVCRGRSLTYLLKICCTLFEKHSEHICEQDTLVLIERLCEKWASNSQKESTMCPILESLVNISSGKPGVFSRHGPEIFLQVVGLLTMGPRIDSQKAILLRSIDLISALVALDLPQIGTILTSDACFHERIVYELVSSKDREIRHFGYALIGDICRQTPIPDFAHTYMATIAHNFDRNNLTTCSNALACMTDLILTHSAALWTPQYIHSVMGLAVEKLAINNLHRAYGFNFARTFGRLGLAFPEYGLEYVSRDLKRIAISLRSHETQKLTTDSFRGIFNIIQLWQGPLQHFEYLVESFLCYKCEEPQLEQQFRKILISYKKSQNSQEWNDFLQSSNFLPAVSHRVSALCN